MRWQSSVHHNDNRISDDCVRRAAPPEPPPRDTFGGVGHVRLTSLVPVASGYMLDRVLLYSYFLRCVGTARMPP